jgi:hypothetical protein
MSMVMRQFTWSAVRVSIESGQARSLWPCPSEHKVEVAFPRGTLLSNRDRFSCITLGIPLTVAICKGSDAPPIMLPGVTTMMLDEHLWGFYHFWLPSRD